MHSGERVRECKTLEDCEKYEKDDESLSCNFLDNKCYNTDALKVFGEKIRYFLWDDARKFLLNLSPKKRDKAISELKRMWSVVLWTLKNRPVVKKHDYEIPLVWKDLDKEHEDFLKYITSSDLSESDMSIVSHIDDDIS